MGLLISITVGCIASAAGGAILAIGFHRCISKLSTWFVILIVALLFGYAALHIAILVGQAEVAANSENADAEGPLVFVAVMAYSVAVAFPAMIAAGFSAAYALKRADRE